jgi:hypothetical protein
MGLRSEPAWLQVALAEWSARSGLPEALAVAVVESQEPPSEELAACQEACLGFAQNLGDVWHPFGPDSV